MHEQLNIINLDTTVESIIGPPPTFAAFFSTEWWALSAKKRKRHLSDPGKRGREMEKLVVRILDHLKEQQAIHSFTYHTPQSAQDQAGKDFSVRVVEGAGIKQVSFGVTISSQSAKASRKKHPKVPILHLAPTLTLGEVITEITTAIATTPAE
jgi:hypothetical protein